MVFHCLSCVRIGIHNHGMVFTTMVFTTIIFYKIEKKDITLKREHIKPEDQEWEGIGVRPGEFY